MHARTCTGREALKKAKLLVAASTAAALAALETRAKCEAPDGCTPSPRPHRGVVALDSGSASELYAASRRRSASEPAPPPNRRTEITPANESAVAAAVAEPCGSAARKATERPAESIDRGKETTASGSMGCTPEGPASCMGMASRGSGGGGDVTWPPGGEAIEAGGGERRDGGGAAKTVSAIEVVWMRTEGGRVGEEALMDRGGDGRMSL